MKFKIPQSEKIWFKAIKLSLTDSNISSNYFWMFEDACGGSDFTALNES